MMSFHESKAAEGSYVYQSDARPKCSRRSFRRGRASTYAGQHVICRTKQVSPPHRVREMVVIVLHPFGECTRPIHDTGQDGFDHDRLWGRNYHLGLNALETRAASWELKGKDLLRRSRRRHSLCPILMFQPSRNLQFARPCSLARLFPSLDKVARDIDAQHVRS
jgi:hypothetical protein